MPGRPPDALALATSGNRFFQATTPPPSLLCACIPNILFHTSRHHYLDTLCPRHITPHRCEHSLAHLNCVVGRPCHAYSNVMASTLRVCPEGWVDWTAAPAAVPRVNLFYRLRTAGNLPVTHHTWPSQPSPPTHTAHSGGPGSHHHCPSMASRATGPTPTPALVQPFQHTHGGLLHGHHRLPRQRPTPYPQTFLCCLPPT